MPKSFASPLWSPVPFYMSAMGMQGARFIEGDTSAGVPDPAPADATHDEGDKAGEVSQGGEHKPSEDDFKSDESKKAVLADLAKEREQRRTLSDEVLKVKNENETLSSQITERDNALAAANLEIARLKALNEFPVPTELQSLVTGNDAESLRKSAELLSKHTKGNGVVHKSGTSGGDPNPSGGSIAAGREMFTANKPKKVGA